MQEIYVYRPDYRLPCMARLAVVGLGVPLIWQWPDGDWCWLDQRWRWEWRHKSGGRIESFL
ncbi:hypothetical protein M5C97_18550 [Acidovorax sp. NCPPB 3859]|nr:MULTISPECIES: hypothetical protein [unclassified Acidovorax]MDA8450389.1 hypothetical protein [Acidovorax sp. GBBC 3297]MDA8459937.1 hypothetical protein [Acidovorax sp. GBBC 3333]MDA8464973.1 hypothetical protein [Acidovorax sp. GBBC 3332]MDA8469904.1 hypothetical protein [Acidovorax sp. GBBC 3299]WCM77499.1 hypothetical protein M5C94_18500 [Acidovorax sp. GBBC 712]